MKDEQDRRQGPTGPPMKDSRQDRLKQALRENLKRRKSQARGRSEAATAPEAADADEVPGRAPDRRRPQ